MILCKYNSIDLISCSLLFYIMCIEKQKLQGLIENIWISSKYKKKYKYEEDDYMEQNRATLNWLGTIKSDDSVYRLFYDSNNITTMKKDGCKEQKKGVEGSFTYFS